MSRDVSPSVKSKKIRFVGMIINVKKGLIFSAIKTGNNPMVGMTVAVAVAIEEASK